MCHVPLIFTIIATLFGDHLSFMVQNSLKSWRSLKAFLLCLQFCVGGNSRRLLQGGDGAFLTARPDAALPLSHVPGNRILRRHKNRYGYYRHTGRKIFRCPAREFFFFFQIRKVIKIRKGKDKSLNELSYVTTGSSLNLQITKTLKCPLE